MDAVSGGKALPATCSFIEPNLEFRAIFGAQPVLRVYFRLEARPKWASNKFAEKEDIWVEFPLDELDLRSTAREWRGELSAYPQRAPR